jgi:23S rRNA (guanosine2251-2'-O)-methyltransferase
MAKNKGEKDILLYGRHPVTMALQNPRRQIREILAVKGAVDGLKIPTGVFVRTVAREQLDALVGRDAVHQGIVARCAPTVNMRLKDILKDLDESDGGVVLLLDQVTDPHNIGAILRSAAAFGALAVIVPEAGAPDETGVLAKSASGALEVVPLVRVTNLARAMDQLKELGFWCTKGNIYT